VNLWHEQRAIGVTQRRAVVRRDAECDAALDALDHREPAVVGDVGRL
jgi:hypothetical protein